MLNSEILRILHVDLATGESRVEDRTDLFRDTLGGTGAAVRLGQAVGVVTPLNTFIYNSLLPLELKARGQVQFTI
jgi:hypothetical protein